MKTGLAIVSLAAFLLLVSTASETSANILGGIGLVVSMPIIAFCLGSIFGPLK